MSASFDEITRDIVIAMIENNKIYPPVNTGTQSQTELNDLYLKELSLAYERVYKTVSNAHKINR